MKCNLGSEVIIDWFPPNPKVALFGVNKGISMVPSKRLFHNVLLWKQLVKKWITILSCR